MTDNRTAEQWTAIMVDKSVTWQEMKRLVERILAQGRREGFLKSIAALEGVTYPQGVIPEALRNVSQHDMVVATITATKKEIETLIRKELDNDTD